MRDSLLMWNDFVSAHSRDKFTIYEVSRSTYLPDENPPGGYDLYGSNRQSLFMCKVDTLAARTAYESGYQSAAVSVSGLDEILAKLDPFPPLDTASFVYETEEETAKTTEATALSYVVSAGKRFYLREVHGVPLDQPNKTIVFRVKVEGTIRRVGVAAKSTNSGPGEFTLKGNDAPFAEAGETITITVQSTGGSANQACAVSLIGFEVTP